MMVSWSICSGGGGIPVVRTDGVLAGIEAVIDKDLAASLLACSIQADALLLLTSRRRGRGPIWDIEAISIRSATVAEVRAMALPAGSMGPEVEAVCRFVEATQGIAAIGLLADAGAVPEGRAGTRVIAASSHETDEPSRHGSGAHPSHT